MFPVVTLFHHRNELIKITVEAGFDVEALCIEGYDIGRRVEEYWGDSDYEYSTTVRAEDVPRVYEHLEVPKGDKDALLSAIASRFQGNKCYSEIQQWLDDHKIPYEGFSWT